jgi:hypothetical protein
MNFVGMMEAVDAGALFDQDEPDGLLDRLLLSCARDGDAPTIWQATYLEGSAPLQAVLSAVRDHHNGLEISYGFTPDAREEFQRFVLFYMFKLAWVHHTAYYSYLQSL